MRVSILVMVSAHVATLSPALAAKVETPYEAVVQRDDEFVRMGPGEAYPPTSKLSAGQRVTVRRHDPGGWFQIDPPPGSFSWIDARFVKATGDGRGVVHVPAEGGTLPSRIEVWIGSEFTNELKYCGRWLATGDEVTILGEMVHQTAQGPTKFYKIEPPRMEGRYVRGNFLQPVSEVASKTAVPQTKPARLTSQAPGTSRETTGESDGPAFVLNDRPNPPGFGVGSDTYVRPSTRAAAGDAFDPYLPDRSANSAAQYERDWAQLRQLDEQLDAMLSTGPAHWRLAEMEQAYRALQAAAAPGIADMIDARLATIEARKPIQAEYDAFVAITKRTDQRDAELFALQNALATGVPLNTSGAVTGGVQPVSMEQSAPGTSLPRGGGETSAHKVPGADLAALDGAGIVSRVRHPQPGVPPHILVAPDGRLLAYLTAEPGIHLDTWLGQSVGLVGPRTPHPQLRADLIHVTRITPVHLQQ